MKLDTTASPSVGRTVPGRYDARHRPSFDRRGPEPVNADPPTTDISGRPRWQHPAVVGLAVLVALAGIVVSGVDRPLVHADEAGYLLGARHLAGLGAPSTLDYFAGYSFVLTPIFYVTTSYPLLARLTQVVNIALLVVSFVLLVELLRRLRPDLRSTTRVAVSTVAMAYPTYVVLAGLAMSESLVVTVVLAVTSVLERSLRRASVLGLTLGAGLSAVAVSIHPRLVVVPIAYGIVVVIAATRHLVPKRAVAASAIAGLLGTAVAVVMLSATDSLPSGPSDYGPDDNSVVPALGSLQDIVDLLATAIGHTFYLVVATFGLFAVGVAVLIGWAIGRPFRGGPASDSTQIVAYFTLLVLAGALAVSTLFMAGGTGDRAIYGRYTEVFAALPLALGLCALWSSRDRLLPAILVGSILATTVAARLLGDPARFGGIVNQSNILAVLPVISWREGVAVGWLGLVSLVVALALLSARRFAGPFAALVVVGCCFAGAAGWAGVTFLQRGSESRAEQDRLVGVVEHILDGAVGPSRCVTLDRREFSQWHRYNYEALLPTVRVDAVDLARTDHLECDGPVLSTSPDVDELLPGSRLVRADNHSGAALWVMPGPQLDQLAEDDALYPAGWDGVVPESASVSELDLSAQICLPPGVKTTFEVGLTHGGTGSPWPSAASLTPRMAAPVRLLVKAVRPADSDGVAEFVLADLPDTVMPGSSVDVEVEVGDDDLEQVRRDGGQLRLQVIQDGVAEFRGERLVRLRAGCG